MQHHEPSRALQHARDARGRPRKERQVEQDDHGVDDEQRLAGVRAARPARAKSTTTPVNKAPAAPARLPQGAVDREEPGPALVGGGLGQDRPLDGDEGTDLRAASADGPGEGAQDQQPELVGEDEAAGDQLATTTAFAVTLDPIAPVYNAARNYGYLGRPVAGLILLLAEPLARGWNLVPTRCWRSWCSHGDQPVDPGPADHLAGLTVERSYQQRRLQWCS